MPEKILFCSLNGVAPPIVALGASSMTETADKLRLVLNGAETSITNFDVSPDGRYLATGGSWGLLDLQTGQKVTLSGWPGTPVATRVSFSPDSKKLAVTRSSSPYFHVFDLEAGGSLIATQSIPSSTGSAVWSPDGTRCAVSSGGTTSTNVIYVFNTATWNYQGIPRISTYSASEPAWSPDSSRLGAGFSGSSPQKVRVWNKSDLSEVSIASTPDHDVSFTKWSPDGAWIACCNQGSAPNVTVYNASTMEKQTLPAQGSGIIRGLDWMQDSSAFVVSYDTGASRLVKFAAGTWEQSAFPNAPTTLPLRMIKFTGADMRRVSTGSGQILDDAGAPAEARTVRVHDRSNGALITQATTDAAGKFSIPFVSFSPVDVRVLDDDAGTVHADLNFPRVIPAIAP